MGPRERVDADAVRNAASAAARAMERARGTRMALALDGTRLDPAEAARCAVDGVMLGTYRYDRFRTATRDLPPAPAALALITADRGAGAAARREAVAATATNRARDLQNAPPNVLGPQELADRARELARDHASLRARVLDRRGLQRRRMGAFLATAQASSRPPLLIAMEHTPSRTPRRRGEVVLGIVGKGLTYDSGGYSLKPRNSLVGMKYDMSGAAAAIEATAAIAELGLPLRVVTVVGACENMIARDAMKVDDVVTASNGKTIEITNTDAEGRLVLADCLHYARGEGATHVVDLATLTGGIVTGLGDFHAGLFGRDQDWVDRLMAAGERSGDHLWPMPLHDTFRRLYRSDIADMANSGTSGGAAQPCFAAHFLSEFAGDGPWAHLDIAGTADLNRPRDYFAKGGTGFGVRLLVELAESLC
jgi:leucyl aminopeptidase